MDCFVARAVAGNAHAGSLLENTICGRVTSLGKAARKDGCEWGGKNGRLLTLVKYPGRWMSSQSVVQVTAILRAPTAGWGLRHRQREQINWSRRVKGNYFYHLSCINVKIHRTS